jgi:hypothetical protein
MNDFDLESKLKSVPVPERPEEYWNDFPSRVRVQLSRPQVEFRPSRAPRLRPVLGWNFAVAAILVLLCLQYRPVQAASAALVRYERGVHAQLARLDTGLRRVMLNTDGMGYLLADPN